jgi:hypothetical protein
VLALLVGKPEHDKQGNEISKDITRKKMFTASAGGGGEYQKKRMKLTWEVKR